MNETVGLEAWPLYCHCQRVLHKFEFQGRVQPGTGQTSPQLSASKSMPKQKRGMPSWQYRGQMANMFMPHVQAQHMPAPMRDSFSPQARQDKSLCQTHLPSQI